MGKLGIKYAHCLRVSTRGKQNLMGSFFKEADG
jgi:hypothetical protein